MRDFSAIIFFRMPKVMKMFSLLHQQTYTPNNSLLYTLEFHQPTTAYSTLLHLQSSYVVSTTSSTGYVGSSQLHQLSTTKKLTTAIQLLLIAHNFISYLPLIAQYSISCLLQIAYYFTCYLRTVDRSLIYQLSTANGALLYQLSTTDRSQLH